jgi:manganese-dependent inorganic pyrophosphatase
MKDISSAHTYIVGHKNPDLDAICSAVAYQAYKEATGQTGYLAIRCGNSNARIDAVFKHFKMMIPPFVADVTPRVRDIMTRDLYFVTSASTCFEALRLIDDHDVRALPVLSTDNKLEGLISIFNLGEFFVPKPSDPRKVRHVRTSIDAILRSLKAEPLNLVRENEVEDLFVRIGAMSIDSFGRVSQKEGISHEQSIVIVGDRFDIQKRAIDLKFRLIIVTGGCSVDSGILKTAQDNGVSIIRGHFDSATTSWITRAAEFVGPVMDQNVFSCHVDEKLSLARKKVADAFAATIPVLDSSGQVVGIFSRGDLARPIPRRLILVDHNELTQAIDGASELFIDEIIDHHRLGNPHSVQPIFFHNEPVGSTSTIVASMFRTAGIKPSPGIAGLMMAGLISDTLNLRSPTATPKDADILSWLSSIAGMSGDDLNTLIFSSGSALQNLTPEEAMRADCKMYESGSHRYAIAQIEELGFDNFWKNVDAIDSSLKRFCEKDQLIFAALLVTDVKKQDSLLLVQGNTDFLSLIDRPTVQRSNIFNMPGVVSRKKQLTPYLSSLVEEMGI